MNFNTFERIADGTTATFSLIGFLANIISISYFIKSEKNGLPNKLMICLNFTDILSSLIFIMYCIVKHVLHIYELQTANGVSIEVQKLVTLVNFAIFTSTCIISGCLTFGLTLLRTIVIYDPFSRIKQKLFVSCLVIVIVVFVTLIQMYISWVKILLKNLQGYIICPFATAILS